MTHDEFDLVVKEFHRALLDFSITLERCLQRLERAKLTDLCGEQALNEWFYHRDQRDRGPF